jgi:bifunctional pyridoxal-dependent enzyme with beta-cystathionase and maltose regulon repressor activities
MPARYATAVNDPFLPARASPVLPLCLTRFLHANRFPLRSKTLYLLEHADVTVLPGEDFGLSPYIRVSFANPQSTIEEAGRRLKHACEALR